MRYNTREIIFPKELTLFYFREFLWNIHYIWSLPLRILIIIVLVYTNLGISAALGSILGVFITIPCQFLVGKAMSSNNRNIMEAEDKRLQACTEALQNMKTLKLNCWEDLMLKRINGHRSQELKFLEKDSFFWVVMAFFASISTLLVTTITIGKNMNELYKDIKINNLS